MKKEVVKCKMLGCDQKEYIAKLCEVHYGNELRLNKRGLGDRFNIK